MYVKLGLEKDQQLKRPHLQLLYYLGCANHDACPKLISTQRSY